MITKNNLLNQYREAILKPEKLENCPVGSEVSLSLSESGDSENTKKQNTERQENTEEFLLQKISQDSNNSSVDILKTKKKL